MSKEMLFRIVLKNPVKGVVYGIQKGKGNNYETLQAQTGNSQDLTFEFEVTVKLSKGGTPLYGGPFIQGSVGNRFVYIDIGRYAGQAEAQWSGRLKVPFPEAGFQEAHAAGAENSWCCTVPGTTTDGKPLFATVKPFGGWLLQKQSI